MRRRSARAKTGCAWPLGATANDILGLTLKDGLRILGLGLALGLAGSFYLSRSLASVLFQVPPYDPWTIFSVSVVLAGAVLLSSVLPARRAARMDPMKALRYE
ncbi:MAG: FtsX-like permease family protein [Vicinamibacteria bacterium]